MNIELVRAKRKVLKLLRRAGFTRLPRMKLYTPLRRSNKNVYGEYEVHSQFKGKLKIFVDVQRISRDYTSVGARTEQIELTIAHEVAHSLVEAIEYYKDKDPFDVPDWYSFFEGDEEEFAELFAICLLTGKITDYLFFDEFIPSVAACYSKALEIYV